MKKIFFFFFSLTLFITHLHAQNIEFKKENFREDKEGLKLALKDIKAGDEIYEKIPCTQAAEYYLSANKFNSNNAILNFKIGNSYLHSNNKLKSIPFLEKAYNLDQAVDPTIRYLLGQAYHLNMEWDKAVKEYKSFLETVTDFKIENIVHKKIAECAVGVELIKQPLRVFIDNVGSEINTSFPDYGPVISADESVMIFTSRRDNSTGQEKDQTNSYFEDIYLSENKGKKWTPAVNLGEPINTKGHDAAIGLSSDGQKLYIYLDDQGDGNIYECVLKGEKWSKPERLGKNINSTFHESSGSISSDGKTFYFVSDRDGGYGSRDIYMSIKDKKGKWGEAVNLGPVINTKYGEEGVFIHPDGKTLYFSSEGHETMGGYDIFKSVYADGKWSDPKNLGYPINSPDMDISFVMSASGKHGYFTSVTNQGLGDRDIYMVTFLGPEKPPVLNSEDNLLASLTAPVKETVIAPVVEIKTSQITILKGIITDAISQNPLEATIDIVDNQLNEVIASFQSNSKTGRYLVSLPSGKNYGIAVKKENYLFHSENFDIPALAAYQEITKDIVLNNVTVGTKIVLNNIFFAVGKATFRPESNSELERLLKLLVDVPTLKIEISGHTDNKSSAEYNLKLSENRAKAVLDYLVKNGITTDRLVAAGYGFSQPIAPNDTEEGRQTNRRTEFKVLSK